MAEDSTLTSRLDTHVSQLEQDASIPLDQSLFEECEAFLTAQLDKDPQTLKAVITRLSAVVSRLQQDPQPITRVLGKLTEPLSFSDVLSLEPPVDFVAGLSLSAQYFNALVLSLLSKAATNPKDAACLAGMPAVIFSLVKLWLCATDMGVADRAGQVFLDLLKIDKEPSEVLVHGVGNETLVSGGQGLMWRRVFGDKDVYGLLYFIPSLSSNSDQQLGKRAKSVAQARLMAIVPDLCDMDWSYLTRSHHVDIESLFGLGPDEGILHFVCMHLVDYKNDVLIHMNLLQFYSDLISKIKRPSLIKHKSLSVQFVQEMGLHDRSISYWLKPDDPTIDPVDLNFLYGPSAHYLATYVHDYPDDFLAGPNVKPVLMRISRAIDLSANQWAHTQSPKHDLSVLSSLPRVTLLPQGYLGTGRQSSPLFQVPCKVTNEDAIRTLGTILGGPRPDIDTSEAFSTLDSPNPEAQAARALFHAYLHFHPTLFADLITHADTVALPDKAIAAIQTLCAIISSNWAMLPDQNNFDENAPPSSVNSLPSEEQLASRSPPFANHSYHFGTNGISVITAQPARDKVLPYLLRPPRTFSNLVGGRGDQESAAYRIAMVKWECLLLLQQKLQEEGERHRELLEAVDARVREGPWGTGAEIGGRIATLEL